MKGYILMIYILTVKQSLIKTYFMKRMTLLFTILFSVFYFNVNAQEKEEEQKEIARLEIRDARINGESITKKILQDKNSYLFYRATGLDELLLSFISDSNEDQTYGNIYMVTKEINQEKRKKNKKQTYNFYWSYSNSFDDYKGTYKGTFSFIQKKKGVYFELSLKQENLDEFLFRGEFKGDFTFLEEEVGK